MAKTKTQATSTKKEKKQISRSGVHAKSKTSKTKNSTNYKKPNVGQGK